ncbi:uncharacterized protein LOC129229590 [Uloborus diversus]|uniref:uncharacterized protein LOC129229590 n=1 Tax=Uloborus diversus TaxID=327109 RepID=UPI002409A45E|nr:uncharacterized protein LOC129229590 [Uloborus diversus]
MATHSFAGFSASPKPSPWGYSWTTENDSSTDYRSSPSGRENVAINTPVVNNCPSSPEPQIMANQYVNLPAALLTSLKREKKPFTYTPGGVNLSEVLNARLQKRMERKKKYSEERMSSTESCPSPVDNSPKFEPPKQVIVMPTYNSPLDMYSMENALEALEVQAELVAADKSLSAASRSATLPRNHTFKFDEKDMDSNRGVAQSKAFKVLQIITDTEEEPNYNDRKKGHHEEMRFTGIRDSKAIPSKFFHTLQMITGTEEDEEPNGDSTHQETQRTAFYEKQPSRSGFNAQQKPAQNPSHPNTVVQNHVPHFQPMGSQRNPYEQATNPAQQTNTSALKRPAAFLPMKTGGDPLSRVKPVHPSFLTNGPRKVFNPSTGTDF